MEAKICKACGMPFTPRVFNQKYCDRAHTLKCPICGKEYMVYDKRSIREGPKACSQACINALRRRKGSPGVKPNISKPVELQPDDLSLRLLHTLRSYQIPHEPGYSIHGYRYTALLSKQKILMLCSNPQFGQDKFLHRTYTSIAKDSGFRCMHVYPFDNMDLIVRQLYPKTQVDLQQCTLYKLHPAVGGDFLDKWHIQKSRKGQKLIVGIAKGQTILQAMAFGNARDKSHYVELMRFCTIPGVQVPGGYAKMLEFATEGMGLSRIISYCDIAHMDPQEYKNMGLTPKGQTQVQKLWIKDREYVKQCIQNQNRWTDQDMLDRGFYLDYDCGQYIFEG